MNEIWEDGMFPFEGVKGQVRKFPPADFFSFPAEFPAEIFNL